MFALNLSQWIIRAIVVIISLTIHEFSHGLVSYLQGDRTPGDYGRLTLNPIAHIDPIGLIALFLFRFGWAKPIPINPHYYKHRRLGIILTSVAGPLSNFILCFLGVIVLIVTNPQSESVNAFFISELIFMNAALAVFNLIPIPPLDGSKIFAEIFGGKIAEIIYSIEQKGTIILFLLLWLPPVSDTLSNLIYMFINGIYKIALLFV